MARKKSSAGTKGTPGPNNNAAAAMVEAALKAGDNKLAGKLAKSEMKNQAKKTRRAQHNNAAKTRIENRVKREADIQKTHRTVARSTAAASAVNSAAKYAENMAGGYILPGSDLNEPKKDESNPGTEDKTQDTSEKQGNLAYPTNVR